MAESIADAMHASLYEIVPEEPYTEEDLNYDQENSRSTIEMKDSTARPAISGSVENMEQYHIIFLGYPSKNRGMIIARKALLEKAMPCCPIPFSSAFRFSFFICP